MLRSKLAYAFKGFSEPRDVVILTQVKNGFQRHISLCPISFNLGYPINLALYASLTTLELPELRTIQISRQKNTTGYVTTPLKTRGTDPYRDISPIKKVFLNASP